MGKSAKTEGTDKGAVAVDGIVDGETRALADAIAEAIDASPLFRRWPDEIPLTMENIRKLFPPKDKKVDRG
jgi:hypothetical protein